MGLHIFDAKGDLGGHAEWVVPSVKDAYAYATRKLQVSKLEVLILVDTLLNDDEGVTFELTSDQGFLLRVNPKSTKLIANDLGLLECQVARGVYSAARAQRKGVDRTLGETVVTAGLCGHFLLELYGGKPDAIEMLPKDVLAQYAPLLMRGWNTTDFPMESWFCGQGGFPKGIGNSLGFAFVAPLLGVHPKLAPSSVLAFEDSKFRSLDGRDLGAFIGG